MARQFEPLPRGVNSLTGACAAEGWVLGVNEEKARRWTAAQGWNVVDDAPGEMEILGRVEGGILCQADRWPDGRALIGLWRLGAPGWAFWQEMPDLFGDIRIIDDRTLVVRRTVFGFDQPPVQVYVVEPDRLNLVQSLGANDPEFLDDFLGGRRTRGGLELAGGRAVYRVEPGTDAPEVVARIQWPEDQPKGEGCVVHGERLAIGMASESEGALVLDLSTGRVERVSLPGPSTGVLERLWRAYLSDDRSEGERLVRFVASIRPRSACTFFDLVYMDAHPWAVVSSDGLLRPLDGSLSDPAHVSVPFDTTPWRLWLDPEGALPEALDEYLRGSCPSHVAEALARHTGERLAALAVERFRGRPDVWLDRDNVRRLFSSAGPAVAGLVLRAMEDEDLAVAKMGMIVAGAPAVGAALQADDVRPRFERQLRRRLGAPHWMERAEAIELVGELSLVGFSGELLARAADEEGLIRRMAVDAAARLTDRSPELDQAVARIARLDPKSSARNAAVTALASASDPANLDLLLAAAGDVEPNVRSTAAVALQKKGASLPRAVLDQALDLGLLLLAAGREVRRGRLELEELARDGERLVEGMGDALARSLAGLTDGGSDPPDPQALSPALRGALEAPSCFALVADVVFPNLDERTGNYDVNEAYVEEAVEMFAQLAAEPFLTRGEIERLAARPGRPPARMVAQLADRVGRRDTGLADRIAVLGLLASRRRGRLLTVLTDLAPRKAIDPCRQRCETLAGEASSLGLLAAYALALRGGEAERDRFERRLHGEDLDRFPVTAIAAAALVGKKGIPGLLDRLFRETGPPSPRRAGAAEAVRELGGIQEPSGPEKDGED